MHPSFPKLSKQDHHLICESVNVIDTDEVVNIADVKLKAIPNILFDFFKYLKNSTSYEYENKLAKSGAQFVPTGILIHCQNKWLPILM